MQISIVTVIDVEAALIEGTLDNNAYVVDNTQNFAVPGDTSGELSTQVIGVHNVDGSQAAEAVLNWITIGVSGVPNTLPRAFHHRHRAAESNARLLTAVKAARTPNAIAKLLGDHENGQRSPSLHVRNRDGEVRTLHGTVMNSQGEAVDRFDLAAAGNLPPVVTNIYGPAVDQGVMYPALYGSPDVYTEGWYWSASVDTSKVGQHVYSLDVVLHEPVAEKGRVLWVPRTFTQTSSITVTKALNVNGFTGCIAPGVLPMVPAASICAGGAL
ncbi:hypothetical protein [Azospirillum brasilense]|uniref:Uncharacterized protein n=1 Tax=Azospirillum brasilense TaxID=192 RepID=A0A6L3ATM2_AZOBR|nr:hypothetical protein [Azospirillum brasilense]KAA0678920.1 hypothetical protein DS837_27100 [Azospirillum brasilense]